MHELVGPTTLAWMQFKGEHSFIEDGGDPSWENCQDGVAAQNGV